MRLGGPVFAQNLDPVAWAAAVRAHGYSAANCPVNEKADDATVRAYRRAADAADLVIAEVGAWSNPISPDPEVRRAALELCQTRLDLAERIGARCCVNIAGSRGSVWDGPSPENLSPDTFDLIVETVRAIIDAVKPTRTTYALETMPWIYPDSPDSYLQLIEAIDRPAFAVHLDPVNLVNSPRRYYENAALLRECFQKLGPYIVSCHAKDITLSDQLTVHLDEVRPGLGGLDYGVYLCELSNLPADTPLMLEHLPDEQEYRLAAEHIRSVAERLHIELR
ncbi:MAG: sugar phosphate isomerase/epimerase [Chloroflexi bacterium]|nr:sugar phosphate isomerase/epimerase [Chloroflexota bacterium]